MRVLLSSVLSLVVGLHLAGCAQGVEIERQGPMHLRLTWKENPATEATLSWSTTELGTTHAIRYRVDTPQAPQGDAEDAGDWQTLVAQANGPYSASLPGGALLHYHHARLTGLEPATRYRVQVESDGSRSREMWFVTAPDSDVPFAVLYGGDSRSGIETRQQMNRMLARMVAEQEAAERPAILALVHGGDYIVDGRQLNQWAQWLADHELTIGNDGRLLPIIPARGNHDVGPVYNEVFDFPAGDDNYFATQLGPQVRIATLNTEISTAGEQRTWLDEELAAQRPQHRWYVAQYHRPAFPIVKVPSGAYTNWVPLFEQYRVDLVCEADGHAIKRTVPILDNKPHPEGIVYIGEGGLGVGQRTPKTDRWPFRDIKEKNGAGHHVHLLTFHPDRLTVRVVLLGGEVFDEFDLAPRKAVAESAKRDQPDAAKTQ